MSGNAPTWNRLSWRTESLDILTMYMKYLVKMSSARLKQKLLALRRRGYDLLDQLLQRQPLLRGSFTQVYTRCGKSNCWCARSAKGHPQVRLIWSESGQLTTRKVSPQAADQVRELTGNYRQFRSMRRKLLILQEQMRDLLDQYEQSLIAKAQRPLRSLGFTSKMSPRTDRRRQKIHPPKKHHK